jgi:hypothetical protein
MTPLPGGLPGGQNTGLSRQQTGALCRKLSRRVLGPLSCKQCGGLRSSLYRLSSGGLCAALNAGLFVTQQVTLFQTLSPHLPWPQFGTQPAPLFTVLYPEFAVRPRTVRCPPSGVMTMSAIDSAHHYVLCGAESGPQFRHGVDDPEAASPAAFARAMRDALKRAMTGESTRALNRAMTRAFSGAMPRAVSRASRGAMIDAG